MSTQTGALEAVEGVIDGGGDADDVLRAVVAILHERLERFVRISFLERGELVPGPAAGDGEPTASFAISWQGNRVAALELGGEPDDAERALLERVATLVSLYALVGWDTGGERWAP